MYDSAGNHVGYNYNTGQVDLGINGSQYSPGTDGIPQQIDVPVSGDGLYYVEVVGIQTPATEDVSVNTDTFGQHPATLSTTSDKLVIGASAGQETQFQLGLGEVEGANRI